MADINPFPYLSDDTLDACIQSLKIARYNAVYRAASAEQQDQLDARLDEYTSVRVLHALALAERTARLAFTPEKRAELASAK